MKLKEELRFDDFISGDSFKMFCDFLYLIVYFFEKDMDHFKS